MAASSPGDELIVVGCGTVVPEADRAASAFFVSMGDARILIDCGPGALQAMVRTGVPWPALSDLALTHFHGDHVGALAGLFFALRHGLPAPRRAPLDVWGPRGTRRLFEGLSAALGEYLLDPGFEVRIHELAPDETAEAETGFVLRAHKTPHTEESLAYRIEGTAAVGLTGDTGPSETLGPFMRTVDVLVCECSLGDDEVGENHLSPSRVAEIASRACPGTLVLTHIYPHLRLREDPAAAVRAAGYEGRVVVAREGLRVAL